MCTTAPLLCHPIARVPEPIHLDLTHFIGEVSTILQRSLPRGTKCDLTIPPELYRWWSLLPPRHALRISKYLTFTPRTRNHNEQIGSHLLATAFLARYLAKEVGVDPDLAFLVGFFHDIGKPHCFELHGQQKSSSHAQLGALLLETIGFPEDGISAVGWHMCCLTHHSDPADVRKAEPSILPRLIKWSPMQARLMAVLMAADRCGGMSESPSGTLREWFTVISERVVPRPLRYPFEVKPGILAVIGSKIPRSLEHLPFFTLAERIPLDSAECAAPYGLLLTDVDEETPYTLRRLSVHFRIVVLYTFDVLDWEGGKLRRFPPVIIESGPSASAFAACWDPDDAIRLLR